MITAVRAAAKRFGASGALALASLAFGALGLGGCGPWEPEPQAPMAYRVPPPEPRPLTSAELAARADARAAEAQGEGSEVAVGASADEYADTDPSALTEFKPVLEPYGAWVDDSTYGTVWVPREDVVGADFQPYVTAGRWTYSDSTSWVWVSDYDWGWAPFHYGRWVTLPGRGWAWIPGRTYAGAWVVWRTGPVGYEYVGWAPAPPEWYWWNGVAVGWSFGWYHPHYVYCSHSYIYQPGFATYVVRSGPTYAHIHERTHPYSPPPGRVVANPGVGGDPNRVIANPSVGGRTIANPRVAGPRPDEIGMKSPIAPPPSGNAGLAKAEAFASPRTAIAQGAAAPIQTRPRASEAMLGNPSPVQGGALPAGPNRSYSAGLTPSSRGIDPVARAPQVQGVAPSAPRPLPEYRDYRSSRSIGTDTYAQPAPRTMPSSPSVSSPYRSPSASSWSSTPSYRSSAPSVSSSPAWRSSSPSVSSSPAWRSSSPSVSSTPSFRPSAPSSSFRPSSPSVSSPVRSAPSVSAPRSSGSVRSSSGGATRGRR